VHVAYRDAKTYAKRAGKDLPTEARWEFAARGALDGAEFSSSRLATDRWPIFPFENHKLDGYERTSPVKAFPPNGYGLHDMIGNV